MQLVGDVLVQEELEVRIASCAARAARAAAETARSSESRRDAAALRARGCEPCATSTSAARSRRQSRASTATSWPTAVIVTRRFVRSTRFARSSDSSSWIATLNADCDTKHCAAARPKCLLLRERDEVTQLLEGRVVRRPAPSLHGARLLCGLRAVAEAHAEEIDVSHPLHLRAARAGCRTWSDARDRRAAALSDARCPARPPRACWRARQRLPRSGKRELVPITTISSIDVAFPRPSVGGASTAAFGGRSRGRRGSELSGGQRARILRFVGEILRTDREHRWGRIEARRRRYVLQLRERGLREQQHGRAERGAPYARGELQRCGARGASSLSFQRSVLNQ